MTVSVSRGSLVTCEGRTIVAAVLDSMVAALTDDQGLPSSRRHHLDPFGFVPTVALEICEAADVMHLDVLGAPTQLTGLG